MLVWYIVVIKNPSVTVQCIVINSLSPCLSKFRAVEVNCVTGSTRFSLDTLGICPGLSVACK